MMRKIDWVAKLTSRKFWVALVGFITPLLIIFKVPDISVEQITGVIMSGGALIAYILGEGFVDAARIKKLEEQDHDKHEYL